MRAFIGIPFNSDVVEYLEEVKTSLLKCTVKAKPTHKENYHLTLLFIGDINFEHQIKIEEALNNITNENQFEIYLGNPNTFSKGKESILWIGIKDGLNLLNLLNKKLVEIVNSVGFDYDHNNFKPHITLARGVIFINDNKPNFPYPYKNPIKVTQIILYESHQVNGKLTYTPRKTVILN